MRETAQTINTYLETVDGKVAWAVDGDQKMWNRDKNVHVGTPGDILLGRVSTQDVDELNKVDGSFDTVTAGKDDDYGDKDGGNIEVSSFSLGWLREQQPFLLDCSVDDHIQNQQWQEWYQT